MINKYFKKKNNFLRSHSLNIFNLNIEKKKKILSSN